MFFAQTYLFIVALVGIFAAFNIGYLLVLLLAAQAAVHRNDRRHPEAQAAPTLLPRLLIVIPAHDEKLVIGATLSSLAAQDYPKTLYQVLVIADNCTDTTAAIAHSHGAGVFERFNVDQRGKGFALAWAFSQLVTLPGSAPATTETDADAFVIVDADTWAEPNFLRIIGNRLHDECLNGYHHPVALQGRYGVLNQDESWRASLMAGAFDLFNHIKPLGQDYLGMSVGLKGNGMAFTRPVLEMAPWRGHSITEDIDFGLDLLANHGVRVQYVPQARVRAQMPTTAAQASSQRKRWEVGRYQLVRERFLPLLIKGIQRRDIRLIDAACALAALPLSELASVLTGLILLVAGGMVFSLLPHPIWWAAGCCVLMAGFVTYIIGGFRISGAPSTVYASLLKAPFYAVWKIAVFAAGLISGNKRGRSDKSKGGAGPEWVRTERAALPSAPTDETIAEDQ